MIDFNFPEDTKHTYAKIENKKSETFLFIMG